MSKFKSFSDSSIKGMELNRNYDIPQELFNDYANIFYGQERIMPTIEEQDYNRTQETNELLERAKFSIVLIRDVMGVWKTTASIIPTYREFLSICRANISDYKRIYKDNKIGVVFNLPKGYPTYPIKQGINEKMYLDEKVFHNIRDGYKGDDNIQGYSCYISNVISSIVKHMKDNERKSFFQSFHNDFTTAHINGCKNARHYNYNISDELFNSFNSEAEMWEYIKNKFFPLQAVKKKFLVSSSEQEKHSYLVGGTGSGKSELIKFLIVQEILKKERNTILIDPHGDLAQEITNIGFLHKKGFADDIIYFDTLIKEDLYGDYNDLPVINPFEIEDKYLKDDVFIDNCSARIFQSLGEIIGKESTHNMQALLIPCIAVLLKKKGSTLFDLKRFMNDETNTDLVALGRKSHNPVHNDYFQYDFFSKSVQATKQAVSIRLQTILNSTLFSRITCGKTTINLNKFIRSKGQHLIINLNKSTTSSIQRPLGSLILTTIINYAYTLNKSERIGVHLYVDEFQNFVTDSVEEILSQLRKYKVYMTLAHQYTDQIENPLILKSVLANTNIKMIGSVAGNTVGRLNNYGEKNLLQEDVDGLKVGEFLIRVKSRGGGYHKVLVPPTLLDKKTKWIDKPTKIEWLKKQYKNYYKTSIKKEIKPKEETKTKGNNDINFEDFLN